MEKRVPLRERAPSRRDVLKFGLAGALAAELSVLDQLVQLPVRLAMAASSRLPDIQFDIGNFIAPAFTVNGVLVRFGPVFTFFTPAKLTRTPTAQDQATFSDALATIESVFPFSPKGVFTFVGYGIPYFNRLRGGLQGSNTLGGRHMASPDFRGLFRFQRTRVMFQAIGLPRQVADANKLPVAPQINPQSPMWMGFADQQVDSSAAAPVVTFVGTPIA